MVRSSTWLYGVYTNWMWGGIGKLRKLVRFEKGVAET